MILGVESSGKTASCAILKDGLVVAESSLTIGLTHSETLMVLVENMFKISGLDKKDIKNIAVSIGPGSFTGLRIGVAACLGIAVGLGVECVGVSSLLGLCYNLIDFNCVVCAVLDARNNNVYNANFVVNNRMISRVCDDRVINIFELFEELKCFEKNVVFVGDAAKKCFELQKNDYNFDVASNSLLFQRASSICFCAEKIIMDGIIAENIAIAPKYIRLSQAEQQLKKKLADS